MYAKILHGKAFGGLVNYANDPRKNATIVCASSGINLSSNQTITDSLIMHSQLSSRCKKPVAHFILSLSPKDLENLTDEKLERIVNDYMKRMGYDDNPFVAIRHFDRKHPHVHIIVCRVNNQGICTKDSHEKDKNIKVCRELTKEYGLYKAKGKEAVNEDRLRKMDAIRYHVMHGVMESLQVANNWKEFKDELAKLGIRVNFRYNPKSTAIEGISFTVAKDRTGAKKSLRHDVSFSGKQLDASLTLQNLCKQLGNPFTIVHEQARDMYEDARLDWLESHNENEYHRVDSLFPDFDTRFKEQSYEAKRDYPDLNELERVGANQDVMDMLQKAEDVADAENGAFHVGLETLGAIILNRYQGRISVGGGGGSSSQLGWGDDDKYKKKKRHSQGQSTGRGFHR